MRTTDIIVTALFSPAAVAALGIADLYGRLSTSIGDGLGTGMIALASQDTGRGALATRNQAVTQTLLIGITTGLPFVGVGLLLNDWLFAVLGSQPEVVRLGSVYLAIIFVISPARHTARIGERAIQGTGDTRTPMVVAAVANALNIAGSLLLGLGLGPFPDLEIIGVGLATAIGTVFSAGALLAVIWRYKPELALVRPHDWEIGRQILVVSAPKIGEALLSVAAEIPFNALLLSFGTGVNAAYQIGRLIGDHFSNAISIGLNVTASVVVGQELGSGRPAEARYVGWATAVMGALVLGAFGTVIVIGAEPIVGFFETSPETARYAAGYTRAFGIAAPFLGLYVVFAGALQGGSETRIPLLARTTALFGFMLGGSYLLSVPLGMGVPGTYAGIVLYYVWSFLVNAAGFRWSDWEGRAGRMMDERRAGSNEPIG